MYLTSRGLNVRTAALNFQHKVSRSAYTLKHARLRPSIYFERQISLTYMEVSEIQICYPLGHTSYGSSGEDWCKHMIPDCGNEDDLLQQLQLQVIR